MEYHVLPVWPGGLIDRNLTIANPVRCVPVLLGSTAISQCHKFASLASRLNDTVEPKLKSAGPNGERLRRDSGKCVVQSPNVRTRTSTIPPSAGAGKPN